MIAAERAAAPADITVAPPTIAGDTVTFAWSQAPTNPSQRRDSWSLRYPGLDLALFDPRLFLEIFLGLQIHVWSALPGGAHVRLPYPLPATSVELWRDYHVAHGVQVAPLAAADTYDAWRASPRNPPPTAANAVFYTGGRDSSVAASLLAELDGADRLLLVHLAEPARSGRYPRAFPTGSPRHLPGARTAVVQSDFRATLLPGRKAIGPHLELYWLTGLPTLLAHGATLATTAHEIDSYRVVDWPDGRRVLEFRRSRPEWLAGIAGHLQRTIGAGIQLIDINWPLSQTVTHRLLAERYPESPSPASCRPLPAGGWCLKCSKCIRHLLATLAIDHPDPTFDYARCLARSPYISRAIAAIRDQPPSPSGLAPWTRAFAADWEFDEWRHWLSTMDPGRTLPDLPPDAARRLHMLRATYGNAANPQHELWSPRALAALPDHLRSAYGRLLAERFAAVDELPPITLPDGGVMRPGWTVVDTPFPAVAAAARFAP